MSGFTLDLACHAQSAPSASDKVTSSSQTSGEQQAKAETEVPGFEQGEQPINPHPAAATANVPDSPEPPSPQAPAPAAAPTFPSSPVKPPPGFFTRFGWAYLADWTGITPTDPNAPKRRGTDAPIPSPPYPASDWPIGGTQEIGAPDYQSYQLQTAIDGDPLRLSRIKWYGGAAIGANGSTNNRGNPSKGIAANAPSAYDVYPNTIVLDQLALYTERL